MLGDLTLENVQIANIPLADELQAAYAAYVGKVLKRIAIINMREYNYTVNGTSSVPNPDPRPSRDYTFSIPNFCTKEAKVQRLFANGSDAITGITWDGTSYNWELDQGKPVKLENVTVGEKVPVTNGQVTVSVQDSTAVILNF